MDQRVSGVENTIDMLDKAGMLHTGAWKSLEDRKVPLVVDVNGIKVGIVNATYGLNGFENHIDKEILDYMVCFIDQSQVKEQIELCKKNGAEIIIVSPHMGDEYRTKARSSIRKYGEAYIKLGADIIFAHHPHVVNPVENIEVELEDGTKRNGLVFWSLGNFISAQYGIEKEAGAIAYTHIRRDNNTGEIEITSAEYLPTWTYKSSHYGKFFHIVPVGEGIDNPDSIKDLKLKRLQKKLKSIWKYTTNIMGDKVAKPLRNMPLQEK
jgi:poly-gamma-glutamate synthesis protein (capsule biosynthesis protein)